MQERLYQKLIVWQQAHALCLEIYSVTKVYPDAERFRLIDQSCRAAASVPTNIAEGNSKSSVKEKKRYVGIAEGSLGELHYHCLLARDLDSLRAEQFTGLEERITSMDFFSFSLRSHFPSDPLFLYSSVLYLSHPKVPITNCTIPMLTRMMMMPMMARAMIPLAREISSSRP